MPSAMRILVVDDHRLFTAGLCALLDQLDPPADVEECDNGHRALERLARSPRIDLMLLDMQMPSLGGVDLLHALGHRGIRVRTLVVSAERDERQVAQAIAAGAAGFLPKSLAPVHMLDAIGRVLAGGRYLPAHLAHAVPLGAHAARRQEAAPSADAPPELSARQREILEMIERGLSNKEIANVLDLSLSTVKFHITALFRTLGVRTRTECVHVARERLNAFG